MNIERTDHATRRTFAPRLLEGFHCPATDPLLRRRNQLGHFPLMDASAATTALGALAQEHRLALFRFLVQAGSGGLPAGTIADKLGIPNSSLSFHLAYLNRAGLIDQRREGRSLIYTANYDVMNGLIGFLTENCCGGTDCTPATSISNQKETA